MTKVYTCPEHALVLPLLLVDCMYPGLFVYQVLAFAR